MSNKGWECPKCGRCYAVWVGECKHCGKHEKSEAHPVGPQPWKITEPEPRP